jgi:sugar phosphate isomerase/epimerase
MRMMDLAVDLDTHVITTHIGKVPDDENCPAYLNMLRTIERLGKYGDGIGVAFATETGPEKAPILKRILDKADTKSAKVNLDPANFVMCSAQNPAEAVYILKDYIVHTHAKDGIMLENGYAEKILGDGDVNFPEYLAALKDVGYEGFLTIEREAGETRFADIRHAVAFLSENLKKLY